MRHRISLFALAALALSACGEDGDSNNSADGGNQSADASLSLPDADPNAPDADTTLVDANPAAPDASCDVAVVVPPPNTCPEPPAGASQDARNAWDLTNRMRLGMGIPCQDQIASINTAAELHCLYYTSNSGNCIANPHREVSGCENFVAEQFSARMTAAGYSGSPAFEDMHFVNNGTVATQDWIDSVWHRTPILSPWVGEHGYGNAQGCDTMDFGRGQGAESGLMVSYPYDGQGSVPTSFSGNEGPRPPAPPQGFPSGYPIHLYAQGAEIQTHVLRKKCDSEEIPHIWITPADNSLLRNEFVMYSHRPMEASTAYVIEFTGTHQGQAFEYRAEFVTQ